MSTFHFLNTKEHVVQHKVYTKVKTPKNNSFVNHLDILRGKHLNFLLILYIISKMNF